MKNLTVLYVFVCEESNFKSESIFLDNRRNASQEQSVQVSVGDVHIEEVTEPSAQVEGLEEVAPLEAVEPDVPQVLITTIEISCQLDCNWILSLIILVPLLVI